MSVGMGTDILMGSRGDAIPLGARIIMISDTTDAMTTDRPYRKKLTVEAVVGELQKCRGTQFDPSGRSRCQLGHHSTSDGRDFLRLRWRREEFRVKEVPSELVGARCCAAGEANVA